MRTAKDGFRGTKDETVKLGETDTGGQVSVTQVGPNNLMEQSSSGVRGRRGVE
jgi:hypothetical protein